MIMELSESNPPSGGVKASCASALSIFTEACMAESSRNNDSQTLEWLLSEENLNRYPFDLETIRSWDNSEFVSRDFTRK